MRSWVVLLPLLAGCVKPDLGEVPFFCNTGYPECPEGYSCVVEGAQRRCVREGATPSVDSASPDAAVSSPDQSQPTKDMAAVDRPTADQPRLSDMVPPTDTVRPPDQGHLGCQGNSECTDPNSPCCCPVPLVNLLWACFPLCLDPLCM